MSYAVGPAEAIDRASCSGCNLKSGPFVFKAGTPTQTPCRFSAVDVDVPRKSADDREHGRADDVADIGAFRFVVGFSCVTQSIPGLFWRIRPSPHDGLQNWPLIRHADSRGSSVQTKCPDDSRQQRPSLCARKIFSFLPIASAQNIRFCTKISLQAHRRIGAGYGWL